MKLLVKISTGTTKKLKVNPKDLIEKSISEIVEEKLKDGDFQILDFNGTEVTYTTGRSRIVEIDANKLIKNSIEKVIKDELGLKSTRGLSISVEDCVGK